MKIIIIGGVAGGATTAARIRRVDETAEIILLEKGKYISYANCGLPYYIGGVIEERDKLFVQTPEAFSTRFRVDVRTENEAIFIDRKRKTVTIRQSSEDTYEESYDKLVISTGASPVRPPLPGIDLSGIFTLRNVTDTDRIKEYIKSHAPRKAVIVGAGFIGLEMAENLHTQGAKVSIVEMGNQVMAPIDFSMASLVHQHLMDKGVNLYLEQAVASFSREGKGLKVTFKNGQSISADIVILSIGVRPETSLARAAELTIGPAGGIAVNDYLQTSDESIYAIGDAIEFRHPITGKPWLNYLAGPANRQGRIVADNVLGAKIPYEGSIGTSIAKVFDMTVASTGLPGKRLRQEEIDYLNKHGFAADFAKLKYSYNVGLWGTSICGGEILDSAQGLPESAYLKHCTKEGSEQLRLTFEKGELKAVNDEKFDDPIKAIQKVEEIGAAYGIGRDMHVGDTIIGIKGRVGFEAAAPMLIIGAHKFLEKYTLSKWQQYWKDQVANWYGMFLHESQYLEPVMRDIEAMLESSQRNVNGTAILELHPLCFSTVGVESDDDLVKNKFGEYGEMQKGWTAEDAKGFIKVTSTALRAYYSNHKDEEI